MDWFLIFILAVLALLTPTAYAGLIGAPYVPTPMAAVKKAFDEIKLNEDDLLIDLGAGDGKVLLEAARRGARARGYELSPFMWLIIWLRTLGKKNISLYFQNFYKVSHVDATVLFAFLMPKTMPRVKQLLKQQTLPKLRYLLVYAFPLSDIEPMKVIKEPKCVALYIYDLKSINRL